MKTEKQKTMKTKINFLFVLMIGAFIIISNNAEGIGIKVSGAGKISGNICYSTAKLPLSNTSVTLHSSTDSSMIAGTITDGNGTFFFSMLEPGTYFIGISEQGFEELLISDLTINTENHKISLNDLTLNLLPMSDKKRRRILKITR